MTVSRDSRPVSDPSQATDYIPSRVWILVTVLLLFFAAQNVIEMQRESCTNDELVKLTAGYTYLLQGDFRLNNLHPPLLKMLSAIPLLALSPKIDFSDPAWNSPPDQWTFSTHFLYSNDADRLLFSGRLPVVLLTSLLGFFVFRWAQQLYGTSSGLFALALFSFSPTFIAHSHLVTLDAGTAALLTISLYCLWRYSQSGQWETLVWSALMIGAALASKYSAFGMLPAFAILFWISYKSGFFPGRMSSPRPEPSTNRSPSRRRGRESPDRKPQATAPILPERGEQKPKRRSSILLVSFIILGITLLSAVFARLGYHAYLSYFRGPHPTLSLARRSYPFYWHGSFKEGGAWYFFLGTFFVKATAPFLILILIRFLVLIRTWRREWKNSAFLVLPSVLYFVIVSAFANPIGVRYLLPVFPLLMIFSSGLVRSFTPRKLTLSILWVLLAWHVTSSVMAFPYHLSYFNEFVGGPSHGTEWLDDSNVDWGQGLKVLKKVLDERGIRAVTLLSFSRNDNPEYYGIRCVRPPQEEWFNLFEHPQPGIYAISANWVARAKGLGFDWKLRFPIIVDVGQSMFVFEVR